MNLKINALPHFSKILSYRNSYFKNDKMDMKTRTSILKMMNENQLKFLEDAKLESVVNGAIASMNSISDRASQIQERNKRKMLERGLI